MADLKISALTASTTPLAGTEVLPIVQSSTTKQVSVANLTVGRQVAANSLIVQGVATQTNGVAALYLDYTPGTSTTKIEAINPGFAYLPLQISAGTQFLQTNGADRVTISSAGNVTVNTGNLVIGTSGKGIDFSATPGTGTSELLADYEEGTYTPTFTPNTSGTLVLNSADSRNKFVYTKTGRSVAITGYVQFLGSSTPVGTSVTISLPFAAYDGGGTIGGAGIVAVFNGVTYVFNLNAGASTMTWTIAASSITDGLFLTLSFNYTAT